MLKVQLCWKHTNLSKNLLNFQLCQKPFLKLSPHHGPSICDTFICIRSNSISRHRAKTPRFWIIYFSAVCSANNVKLKLAVLWDTGQILVQIRCKIHCPITSSPALGNSYPTSVLILAFINWFIHLAQERVPKIPYITILRFFYRGIFLSDFDFGS